MKFLAWFHSCCLLVPACYAQDISAPIIVAGASQSSVAIQGSDLRVEVNQQPIAGVSLTPLSNKHLKYAVIYDEELHPDWFGGHDQQEHVAKEFLKQVISPGSDVGTYFGFGSDVILGPENEKDPRKVSSEIRATQISPTRLYDAIVAAALRFAKQPNVSNGRKVIFLFSDGRDTGSQATLADAIAALQRASLPLFAFASSDVEKRKQGQQLRELAHQSGGRVYFLAYRYLTFDDVKRDLADGFLLTLSPSPQKGLASLNITEKEHPEVSIVSPTHIFVP
jgi:von Willebrand factor type A domain